MRNAAPERPFGEFEAHKPIHRIGPGSMSEKLAVHGGEPVREEPFPGWPVWDERELEAVTEVFESGTWGVNGTQTETFCDEYAERHDAAHAVTVTNGTIALQIALQAAGVGPGDEVIVPPYTFVATASAVLDCNAVPVFADIERDSVCLDPASVEAQLTDRTAAVIPVHLGGRPADMDALKAVCEPHDVTIVEDCAQAHGSWLDGEAVGTIGDVGCFSFQSSKNLSAGEGGLVLTNDDEIYTRAWSIANVGRVPDGDWYEHPVLGSNHRMTEFQGAILRTQLSRMDDQLAQRERAAQRLHDGLANVDGVEPQSEHPDTTSRAYHLYIFRLDLEALGGISKGQFLEAVRAEGIPAGGGYRPLYGNELFTNIERTAPAVCELADTVPDYTAVSCPETDRAANEVGWMAQRVLLASDEDIDDIARAFAKVADAADTLGD